MAIKKIVIDNKSNAKALDGNKIQVNLSASAYNEKNKKEPDTELKFYVNEKLLQNLTTDLQGNINDSLIVHSNEKEIRIELQDITGKIKNDIKITLSGGKEKEANTNVEKNNFIAQLKIDPNKITSLPKRAIDDPDIVKYALEQNGGLMYYVSERLRNDKKTAEIALQKDIENFSYLGNHLKTDEMFVAECVKKGGTKIIKHIPIYMINTPKVKNEIMNIINKLKEKHKELEKARNEMPETEKNKERKSTIAQHLLWIEIDINSTEMAYKNQCYENHLRWNGSVDLIKRSNELLHKISIENKVIEEKRQETKNQDIITQKEVLPVKTEEGKKTEELQKKINKLNTLYDQIITNQNEIKHLEYEINLPGSGFFFQRTKEEKEIRNKKIQQHRKLIKDTESLGKDYDIKRYGPDKGFLYIGTIKGFIKEAQDELEKTEKEKADKLAKIESDKLTKVIDILNSFLTGDEKGFIDSAIQLVKNKGQQYEKFIEEVEKIQQSSDEIFEKKALILYTFQKYGIKNYNNKKI